MNFASIRKGGVSIEVDAYDSIYFSVFMWYLENSLLFKKIYLRV